MGNYKEGGDPWKKEIHAVVHSHYAKRRQIIRVDFGTDMRWYREFGKGANNKFLKPVSYLRCDKCDSIFAGMKLSAGTYYCGKCGDKLTEVASGSIDFPGSEMMNEVSE